MTDLLRRAAEWLRASWARLLFVLALAVAFWLLADDPIVVREFALNLIRAAAVLLTFEGFIRYSTRRMSAAVARLDASRPRLRFADFFLKIWHDDSAISLAVFLVGNLAVRGWLVGKVWQ